MKPSAPKAIPYRALTLCDADKNSVTVLTDLVALDLVASAVERWATTYKVSEASVHESLHNGAIDPHWSSDVSLVTLEVRD